VAARGRRTVRQPWLLVHNVPSVTILAFCVHCVCRRVRGGPGQPAGEGGAALARRARARGRGAAGAPDGVADTARRGRRSATSGQACLGTPAAPVAAGALARGRARGRGLG
jgi:hypothetical protein